MNKKGFVITGTGLIIFAIILLVGGKFGLDYLGEVNQDKYNKVDVVNPEQATQLCTGDTCTDVYPKSTYIEYCKDKKAQWGLDPFLFVRNQDTGIANCVSCTEFAQLEDTVVILAGPYQSEAKCDCGELDCPPDAEIEVEIKKLQKEIVEEAEIKNDCPAIWEAGGKVILRDYFCELKFKLAQFFQPFIIGASILLGIFIYFATVLQLNKHFKKKKQRTVNVIISIIVAIIIGGMLYVYFIVALILLLVYAIASGFLPSFAKK